MTSASSFFAPAEADARRVYLQRIADLRVVSNDSDPIVLGAEDVLLVPLICGSNCPAWLYSRALLPSTLLSLPT